jgi:hypothetical protein
MDQRGLKAYWIQKNVRSVDGLPGLLTAPDSKVKPISVFDKEGPRPMLHRPSRDANVLSISATLAIGFTLGALAATVLPPILSNVGKFGIFTSTWTIVTRYALYVAIVISNFYRRVETTGLPCTLAALPTMRYYSSFTWKS